MKLRRLAIVHAPPGLYLPGGGSSESERPEDTVEQTHFEKRSIFCDGRVVGPPSNPTRDDHMLERLPAAEAAGSVTPPSHQWAIRDWLSASGGDPGSSVATPAV